MSRSSTSSSRSWRIVLIAFTVVLAAEVLFRAASPPSRPPYYHPGVGERLEALEALDQPVDVLFVGSSVVRTNVDPTTFDRLAAAAGRDVTSFNGGLSAMHLVPNAIFVEELWMEATNPSVVVHFTALQELIADPSDMLDRFEASSIERQWLADSWLAEVRLALLENSAMLQAAGTIPQAISDPGLFLDNQAGFPIDARGFERRLGLLSEKVVTLAPEEIPGGVVARDGYALTPADWERARQAIRKTAASVAATGATYVLVNMPEHPAKYEHPDGDGTYTQYLVGLQSIADELGIAFIDLTEGDWRAFDNDAWFSDYHHMTPAGAQQVTELIAERLAQTGVLSLGP